MVIKLPAIVAHFCFVIGPKSSLQISGCELLYCLFYNPCGFCKLDVRRITKPLSVGTDGVKITITKKQFYFLFVYLSTLTKHSIS